MTYITFHLMVLYMCVCVCIYRERQKGKNGQTERRRYKQREWSTQKKSKWQCMLIDDYGPHPII